MAMYVGYRPCEPEGPASQIVQGMPGFVNWYTTDFAEDGHASVLDLAMALADGGMGTLTHLPPSKYRVLDQLVGEFYGYYCDPRPPPPVPRQLMVGALRMQRYEHVAMELERQFTDEAQRLWSFITAGRGIAPSARDSFFSQDDASWVSWWSLDEVRTLKNDLPRASHPASECAEGVLPIVHEALDSALARKKGLVVTTF